MPESLDGARLHSEKARRASGSIVRAAAHILVAEGPKRLTHRRIAEEAGVSLGLVTKYFSGIEEIRSEAYAWLAQDIGSDYERMIEVIEASGTDVAAMIDALYPYLEKAENTHVDAALNQAALFDERLRRILQDSLGKFENRLTELVGRDRALAVSAFISGLNVYRCVHDAPMEKDVVVRAILALIR